MRLHGLRYRLGLATWFELREAADTALNAGIYSPSLVDAALDADECLWEIGTAFEKALHELGLTLPESQEECCWEVLKHYIEQIENEEVEPVLGLKGVMEVYQGCQLYDCSQYYAGDSHNIHELIGAYWSYHDLLEGYRNFDELKDKGALLALDANVIESCKTWLSKGTA